MSLLDTLPSEMAAKHKDVNKAVEEALARVLETVERVGMEKARRVSGNVFSRASVEQLTCEIVDNIGFAPEVRA